MASYTGENAEYRATASHPAEDVYPDDLKRIVEIIFQKDEELIPPGLDGDALAQAALDAGRQAAQTLQWAEPQAVTVTAVRI